MPTDDRVVLVFHAMDGAFPATYVWNEIRDRAWHEQATVVGISISTPRPSVKKDFITVRLPAVWTPPTVSHSSTASTGPRRDGRYRRAAPAVFLLDEERTVQYRWVAAEWPDFPDYEGRRRPALTMATSTTPRQRSVTESWSSSHGDVYGLGADALDAAAVERVFDAKGRERDKPVSLAVPVSNPHASTRAERP